MIKLKDLIKEDEEDNGIDIDRLHYNDSYLDDVAENMGYNMDFNKMFWSNKYVPSLFHCTTKDKYELIKKDGVLKRRSDTRGINNRSVGSAIFTTMEEEEVGYLTQYYGDIVLRINTAQMKSDGFTPHVEKEPEVDHADKISFVLNKLGRNTEPASFIDSSGGISEYTVIVYDNIPIKYLSLYD